MYIISKDKVKFRITTDVMAKIITKFETRRIKDSSYLFTSSKSNVYYITREKFLSLDYFTKAFFFSFSLFSKHILLTCTSY